MNMIDSCGMIGAMTYPWTVIVPVFVGCALMLAWIWTGPDFIGRKRFRRRR